MEMCIMHDTKHKVCRSASSCHAVCVSAEPLISRISTARRISLGGEGNALYPMLFRLLLWTTLYAPDDVLLIGQDKYSLYCN